MSIINSSVYKTKSGKDVIIRNASGKDAQSIIDINKSILAESIYMLREPEEARYIKTDVAEQIEDHLTKDGKLYIVAEIDNQIAGYLQFENGHFKKTAHTGMLQIFLDKKFRESGIGFIMMNILIKWAEDNPAIEKLTLNVFSSNIRAINLYKKSGFNEEGRCPKDMKLADGTYVDSVLMYKFVK